MGSFIGLKWLIQNLLGLSAVQTASEQHRGLKRSLEMSSYSLTFLFLPLKLPQLLLLVRAAPTHLGVCATLGRAESRHAHVWVRMVDGPILEGVTVLKYNLGSEKIVRDAWWGTAITFLKSQMILGGFSSRSRGQFLIFMLVWPSRTSAHSSVTELKRISFWEVYSKYWNTEQVALFYFACLGGVYSWTFPWQGKQNKRSQTEGWLMCGLWVFGL